MTQPKVRAAVASVAAIAGILAASSCCLPLLPFVFAAGLAGSSTVLTALRPYLLGASVLLVAYGFYQGRRAKQCHRPPGVAASLVLWTSALLVALSVFFPQVLANAAAGIVGGRETPAGQPRLIELTPRNLADLAGAFNAANDDVRLLVLLSPT